MTLQFVYQAPYFAALAALIQPTRASAYPVSLDPMRALLRAVGDPHQRVQAAVVAGSVGKTSMAHQWAAMMAGEPIGLYTSPHLHSFRERFRIDGVAISPAEFIDAWAQVSAAAARLGGGYSTFEAATALCLVWFAARGVQRAVLEIGLGGRYDAVNAAPNHTAILTPIELEHAAMLGGTLESIAWHKAGIIHPGSAVYSAPQPAAALAVIEREAALYGARMRPLPDLPPVALPGRMERTPGGVLIDGAHTPGGLRRLLPHLPIGARVVVGMLGDKRIDDALALLDRRGFHLIMTTLPVRRAASAHELAAYPFAAASVEAVPDVERALALPYDAVTGSLRLAALAREAAGLLSDAEIAEARQTRALIEAKNAAL